MSEQPSDKRQDDKKRQPKVVARTVGAAGKVAKAYVWTLVGDWSSVKQSHTAIMSRIKQAAAKREARSESFEDACERQGLTEADVRARSQAMARQARFYAAIAGLALAVFMALPWVDHPFSHGLMCLAVGVVALTRYAACRFRQAQCDQRRLMSFATWAAEWWGR